MSSTFRDNRTLSIYIVLAENHVVRHVPEQQHETKENLYVEKQ